MTPQDKAREIRAVRECLRYVKADAENFNLMLVSLHIGKAIAEADTALDELDGRHAGRTASAKDGAAPKRRRRSASK